MKSVELILTKLADAIIEGKTEMVIQPLKSKEHEEDAEQSTKRLVRFTKKSDREEKHSDKSRKKKPTRTSQK